MTIVVAVKSSSGVTIGADKLGVRHLDKINRADPKVFITHGIKYGFTSSFRMGQILRYHSQDCGDLHGTDPMQYVVTKLVPMWRSILKEHGYVRFNDGEESGGVFIIALEGRIFTIESDFQVAEAQEDFAAVGCGESFALGFLLNSKHFNQLDRVKKAIETACYFSAGCGGGIDYV